MLETIDARCTLSIPPAGLRSWDYRRAAAGVSTHTLPRSETPEGVSLVAYTRTPNGDHRLRVEGNLTACLYGKQAAVGSLTEAELEPAVVRLLGLARELTGRSLPGPEAWDLHRLDPSATVQLPDVLEVSEVISAAERSWSVKANGRQAVTRTNRETVKLQHSKWRSWTAYDKTSEATSRGLSAPRRCLRLEARIRPRGGSGLWKLLAPTLALTADDRDMIRMELEELTVSAMQQVAATSVVTTVEALRRGGATPNQAYRLASFLLASETLGQDVLTRTGVAESTARRWKSEARKFFEAGGGHEALDESFNELAPVLAQALVVEAQK